MHYVTAPQNFYGPDYRMPPPRALHKEKLEVLPWLSVEAGKAVDSEKGLAERAGMALLIGTAGCQIAAARHWFAVDVDV